jgi:TRAP-type mannitol/chloroaromatic compound transport system permease small subunit
MSEQNDQAPNWVRAIDRVNETLGSLLSWGMIALVLLQVGLVVAHTVFKSGSVPLTELMLYINGAVFLGAAGLALQRDEHVRVDIFYRPAHPRDKAEVNIWGALLFLFPVCGLLWWTGSAFVADSWSVLEKSTETAGLPFVYILKSFILLFATVLTLQGLAETMREWRRMKDRSL